MDSRLDGRSSAVKGQLMKAHLPMLVMLSEKVTELRDEQLSKAKPTISVTLSGITTVVRAVHFLKQSCEIDESELEITRFERLGLSLKHALPTDVTVFGITKDENLAPMKAFAPIETSPEGTKISSIGQFANAF